MHGFTSNSTVAWQVKRGPTATGSFNLPNGAVTPRISSPSDRNQMGRACSLQLQRKDQQPWLPWSGCHERFLRLVVPTGRIRHSKVPKYSGLSIYLSIFPGIFPGLGMSWDVLGIPATDLPSWMVFHARYSKTWDAGMGCHGGSRKFLGVSYVTWETPKLGEMSSLSDFGAASDCICGSLKAIGMLHHVTWKEFNGNSPECIGMRWARCTLISSSNNIQIIQ